jgi:hypothetical protein
MSGCVERGTMMAHRRRSPIQEFFVTIYYEVIWSSMMQHRGISASCRMNYDVAV